MRAEANIRAGKPADAIADLNVIRRRAAIAGQNNDVDVATFNASPIDYLLDERERELAGEERRFFTLTRMGEAVFLRRVKAFNSTASAVQAFHMLRPFRRPRSIARRAISQRSRRIRGIRKFE